MPRIRRSVTKAESIRYEMLQRVRGFGLQSRNMFPAFVCRWSGLRDRGTRNEHIGRTSVSMIGQKLIEQRRSRHAPR